MNVENINSLFDKVSYLKLAGINKFILLDVYKNKLDILFLENKEPVYKFTAGLNIEDYEILSFETGEYSGRTEDILPILKKFTQKHQAEDVYLIIGINEYRTKTLIVDKKTEDVNLWFLENTEKFIPAGRPAKEFSFTYEKYKEDDDNYYYLVAITREEYVSELTKTCLNSGLKILSITAFTLSFHSLAFVKDIKAVFIKITGDVIRYSYSDVNNNLFINEHYHKIFLPCSGNRVNQKELAYSLQQIGEAVKIAPGGNEQGELNVYLSVEKDYYEAFQPGITKILNPASINNGYEKFNAASLSSFFTLLKELSCTNEGKLNFLNNETALKERDCIEKQITFCTTLASGVLLISLLLILFTFESFVSGRIKAGQEDVLEVNAKSALISKFEEENTKFNMSLSLLKKLKDKKSTYSSLIKSLSEIVTSKSCFTGLKLNENENKENKIEITGVALNRQEVAKLMKNMENNAGFSNILLSYSNSIESKKIETNIRIKQSEIIEFKVVCEYNNAD
ncbi:MAG: PilN domain-containing protein [Ignavibacteria bacterium]|jgi:Tfp pilus assembly protein PilN